MCEERDRDRHGRIVAVCRAGGEDLNAWMVSEGWALAYRRYSEAYVDEEVGAKSARAGVWRGEFVPPWDWRQGKRLPFAAPDTRRNPGKALAPKRSAPRNERRDSGGCRIKGNISRSGALHRSASVEVVTSLNRSDCYRLERQLPGRIRTREKTAPFHGALCEES